MSIVGGLSAQLGMVDEVTFGVSPVVTRFLELNDENVNQSIERIESKGLRAGPRRTTSTDDWVAGRIGCGGDLDLEVNNKGFGLLLKHMQGAIATSQPNAGSFPTVYEHKATWGALDGKSFTFQVGRTGTDGTTRAFTYAGGKIPKWSLSCDAQGILMLKITTDAVSESTAVGLATASYAANTTPLVYTGGAITIGGTATDVTSFSLDADNQLEMSRYFLSATTPQQKREQLEGADIRQYSGQIGAEFKDLTLYNKFVNGTVGALTAFFTGANIAGSYNYALEITLAAVRFDGDTPNIGGPGIPQMTLPYKVLDSSASDGPCSIVLRTTDTTP